MNISLSPFAPKDLVSRDGFGRPVPRRPAYSQLRANGVHCRESAGAGPVVLKVVPVTGAAFASPWTN